MKKKIISFAIALVMSFVSLAVLCDFSANAALEVQKEFFGIRDADYFLYNGEVWLENLIFEKDDALSSLTTDNPNRIFFNDLTDKSNNFFAAHNPVYCLEANAAYPWGTTYISSTYLSESTYTADEIKAIGNILKNGYPSLKEYWYNSGIRSYGAQMMATQAAIWIITGELNTTPNQVSYDINALSANYNVYSYDEIGDLCDMVSKLVECGHDTSKMLFEPSIDINAKKSVFIDGTIVHTFDVETNINSTPVLAIRNYDESMKVYVDDIEVLYRQPIEVSPYIRSVKVIVPASRTDNKNVEISLSTIEHITDADSIYWYTSNEQVEKWPGSGLYLRQQLADANTSDRLVSDSEISVASAIPISQVAMTIFKNDEGEGIRGAVFELVNLDDIYVGDNVLVPANTVLDTQSSDENGNIAFRVDLPAGYRYEAREIEFPYGYVACNPVSVVFDSTSSPYEDVSIVEYVSNTPQYGKITLEKQGEVLVDARYDEEGNFDEFVYDVRRVPGALYGLYSDSSCKDIYLLETIMTTEEYVESKEYKILDHDTLYLKELSAPYGLLLDDTVYEVKLVPDKTREVSVINVSVYDERQKVKLGIKKYDATSEIPVSGAGFSLTNLEDIKSYDGSVLLAKGTSIERTYTDLRGEAYFGKNLPVSTYMAYEYDTPLGYKDTNAYVVFDATTYKDTPEIVIKKAVTNTPIIGSFAVDYEAFYSSLSLGLNSPKKNKESNTPSTSDSSNISIYVMLLMFSIFSICLIKLKKKSFLGALVVFIIFTPVKIYALDYEVKSPTIYDGQEYDMEDEISYNNNIYYLDNVKKLDSPVSNTIHVKQNYVFEDYGSALDIPETVIGTATDGNTGKNMDVVLYRTEITESDEWVDDFSFVITCQNINGLYYIHNGIRYDINEPSDFYDVKEMLLEELMLNKDEYIIETFEYAGDEYVSNGMQTRDIVARGKRLLRTFYAVYENDAVFEYKDACIYVGHYKTRDNSPQLKEEQNALPDEAEVMNDEDVVTRQGDLSDTFKTPMLKDISIIIYPLIIFIVFMFVILIAKRRKD